MTSSYTNNVESWRVTRRKSHSVKQRDRAFAYFCRFSIELTRFHIIQWWSLHEIRPRKIAIETRDEPSHTTDDSLKLKFDFQIYNKYERYFQTILLFHFSFIAITLLLFRRKKKNYYEFGKKPTNQINHTKRAQSSCSTIQLLCVNSLISYRIVRYRILNWSLYLCMYCVQVQVVGHGSRIKTKLN